MQYKFYNKEYLEQLQQIWNSYTQLYSLSKNPVRELSRIASVLRCYARQIIKVQELKMRRDYEMSQPTKDYAELNRIAQAADRLAEEKCYVMLWPIVSEDYDNIVQSYYDMNEQHYTFKTSAQILEDAKAYRNDLAVQEMNEIDL